MKSRHVTSDVWHVYVINIHALQTRAVAGLVQRYDVGLDQGSYSTLGPVSAWTGDRLWTDKPPRRRTRHTGLLSLSLPSVAGRNEYPAKAGGVNRHIA